MLAVGVELDDEVGAPPERVLVERLQGGAVAEVEGMAEHRGAVVRSDVPGAVPRAVVDDDDLRRGHRRGDGAEHAGQPGGLVVGGQADDHGPAERHATVR